MRAKHHFRQKKKKAKTQLDSYPRQWMIDGITIVLALLQLLAELN